MTFQLDTNRIQKTKNNLHKRLIINYGLQTFFLLSILTFGFYKSITHLTLAYSILLIIVSGKYYFNFKKLSKPLFSKYTLSDNQLSIDFKTENLFKAQIASIKIETTKNHYNLVSVSADIKIPKYLDFIEEVIVKIKQHTTTK